MLSAEPGGGYTRADPNSSQPYPRAEFGAVLSQQRNAVFVIGGLDTTNSPTRELLTYHVANNTWTTSSLSSTSGPERVLAAAYAPTEDALIVLDQDTSGSAVRLWRVLLPNSYQALTTSLLASWTRTTSFQSFGLTLDGDGEHYDILCDRGASGHAVLRFAPDVQSVDSYVQDTSPLRLSILLGHERSVSVLGKDSSGVDLPIEHDTFDTNVSSSTPQLCF